MHCRTDDLWTKYLYSLHRRCFVFFFRLKKKSRSFLAFANSLLANLMKRVLLSENVVENSKKVKCVFSFILFLGAKHFNEFMCTQNEWRQFYVGKVHRKIFMWISVKRGAAESNHESTMTMLFHLYRAVEAAATPKRTFYDLYEWPPILLSATVQTTLIV